MDPSQVNVVFTYRNMLGRQGVSHAGLAVAATNLAKVMQQNGINARTAPMDKAAALHRILDNDPSITHIVVSALWVPTDELAYCVDQYPRTHFSINCHSNVGFLQTDPSAIRMIREGIVLERMRYNFHVAGNSEAFCDFVTRGYGVACTYLPNLYYLDTHSAPQRPIWSQRGGTLKLGIFGASRWQKNFVTAVAAALVVARELKANTEIWINTGRRDGPETPNVYNAAANLVAKVPNVTLKTVPWAPWPSFRTYVEDMDCLIQPSYSESFNMVTADGVASGVPSAVSDAIDWCPPNWKTETDDACMLADTIKALVSDTTAVRRGIEALSEHNSRGLDAWLSYLVGNRFGGGARTWNMVGAAKYHGLPKTHTPFAAA